MSAAIKLSSPATREFWEIPVLFEDEHLLALDKPAGLPTAPDPANPGPNLADLLHQGIADAKPWAGERGLAFLSLAHRLDADVGGVLLLAKNPAVLTALTDVFGSEKPHKKFIALVWGNPPEPQFEADAKLAAHHLRTGLMCVDPRHGKKSKTTFTVLENFSHWSLVQSWPLTDRPHQVRLHLKHAGFPVVGDELYGGKKLWLSRLKRNFRLKEGREERPLLAQAALHLEEISLPHPVTREPLTLRSEWPKSLRVAVKYLRQFAA